MLNIFKRTVFTLRFVGNDGRLHYINPGDTLTLEQSGNFDINSDRRIRASIKVTYEWDGRTLKARI